MAERPVATENMAVSSDLSASQHTMKDNGKEEVEFRSSQSNPKVDVPKKKTTFKITSVTKSSQRGGSGDLTQDNDLDSQDDLDETVDSHTEDLSSEIYDTNSKATDIDSQDPLLTPEEVLIKEKPARFKVVKVESKEPFKRGRWVCYDYLDGPDKSDGKQEEININSGSSSAANSVHYVHGVDDPAKNPLTAGATGTVPSQSQSTNVQDGLNPVNAQGEVFQPIQPAPSSQYGVPSVSQTNTSYPNHVAQPSVPYSGAPNHPPAQSLSAISGPSNTSLKALSSVPNLPHHPQGQVNAGNSVPYPNSQSHQQAAPQGQSIPATLHSQPAAGASSMGNQQPVPGAMQTEYMNSSGQGQAMASGGQQVAAQQQQGMYDMSSQQGYVHNAVATGSASGVGGNFPVPQQNHQPASTPSQPPDGYNSDVEPQPSLSSSTITNHADDPITTLGAGLAPLEVAVGGITNAPTDDDITEEAGSSTVAIDNKIEQAMDLVKSHLMYAVREEVEVLKEQIKELMERMRTVEYENKVLRSEANPETLAKLPPPLPPLQNPLLQQFMTPQPPSSSS